MSRPHEVVNRSVTVGETSANTVVDSTVAIYNPTNHHFPMAGRFETANAIMGENHGEPSGSSLLALRVPLFRQEWRLTTSTKRFSLHPKIIGDHAVTEFLSLAPEECDGHASSNRYNNL